MATLILFTTRLAIKSSQVSIPLSFSKSRRYVNEFSVFLACTTLPAYYALARDWLFRTLTNFALLSGLIVPIYPTSGLILPSQHNYSLKES